MLVRVYFLRSFERGRNAAFEGVKGAPGGRSPRSPQLHRGRAGTGEDAAKRTLDATRLAKLAMGVGNAFIPAPFACRASPALLLPLIWLLICF